MLRKSFLRNISFWLFIGSSSCKEPKAGVNFSTHPLCAQIGALIIDFNLFECFH